MRKLRSIGLLMATALFISSPSLLAQDSEKEGLEEGMVWSVEYIRTNTGQGEAYEAHLAKYYVPIMEAAKKRGIISDYMMMGARAGHGEDWDVMLMTGFENFAMLDGIDDKFEAMMKDMQRSEAEMKEIAQRFEMREIIGGKMARQLTQK